MRERGPVFPSSLVPASAAPDRADRVRVIEQVAVFVRVVFDDGAVEAGGGHVVEGDADAVHVEHLIVVKRCVGVGEAVAAAAAAGGEGDAEDASLKLLLEVLGGRGGDRNL